MLWLYMPQAFLEIRYFAKCLTDSQEQVSHEQSKKVKIRLRYLLNNQFCSKLSVRPCEQTTLRLSKLNDSTIVLINTKLCQFVEPIAGQARNALCNYLCILTLRISL